MEFLFGMFVGAVIAWNLVPQPEFVRRNYEKVKERFFNFLR